MAINRSTRTSRRRGGRRGCGAEIDRGARRKGRALDSDGSCGWRGRLPKIDGRAGRKRGAVNSGAGGAGRGGDGGEEEGGDGDGLAEEC